SIAASAPPVLDRSFSVDVGNSSSWFTVALLLIGDQRDAIGGFGGSVLVDPLVAIAVAMPPGTFHWTVDVPPDELLAGIVVDLQALELDAGAPRGVSLTPGLELVLGF